MSPDQKEKKYGRLVEYSVAFVVLIIVAGGVIFYLLNFTHLIPLSASVSVNLIVAGVLGFLFITFLGRELGLVAQRVLGQRRGSMVFLVYRFVAYVVLALVLLSIVGVSGTDLLAGGTFAGLVLGLAGQTVLSNIIAGMMIILARPYEISDRVTFVSAQYGLIAPVYPPKFYSHDYIMPGYSGTIRDIGLTYTLVQLDDAPMMKVPNSMMVQAAVVSHELTERWVRTKYEIPVSVDPETLIPALLEKVKKNQWVARPESVRVLVNAATSSIYVVSIDAICRGQFEEQPRSSILLETMSIVKGLRQTEETGETK